MERRLICVFAVFMLITTPGSGQNDRIRMEGIEEEPLECFRCDLGFWDTCYTTETKCSSGERCFTGRGKAAGVLDIKLLGCTRAEKCGVQDKVELYNNNTLFVMTKHCCDTHFCNSAHKHLQNMGLCLAALAARLLSGASL